MLLNERTGRQEEALRIGRQMMTAARTAPKGKGIDIIETAVVTGEEIKMISKELIKIYAETGMKFYLRDSENLFRAEAIVLIGTRFQNQGLNCGYCGFATCREKPGSVPCAINTIDVGIAIGSACSVATDCRADSRVMFSAGYAAQRLDLLNGCKNMIAIPLSISSKNPFFDRNH